MGYTYNTYIVPILKTNGGLGVCGDLKLRLIPCLEVQHFFLTRRYLFSQLQGGQNFSKIDLSDACQLSANIILTEESKKLVTITIHKNFFIRANALCLIVFISSETLIFQNVMEQMFIHPRVVPVCSLDDILNTGKRSGAFTVTGRRNYILEKFRSCGWKLRIKTYVHLTKKLLL